MGKITIKVGTRQRLQSTTIEQPAGEPRPWGPDDKLRVVGTEVPRVDALAKVTGQAKYTADIQRPGLLYAKVLRSPHAAAKVSKLDVEAARKASGVRAALALTVDAVRYQGQPLAAVAAISEAAAEAALAKIVVEYQLQPFVTDVPSARRAGAPLVYAKRGSNVRPHRPVDEGKIARGFKQAKVVVEASYSTQVQTHSPLETHGVVAEWQGDKLTVWASTQGTFGVREELATALKMAPRDVEVITEHMGGGFGAKFGAWTHGLLAAKLAKAAKAPVRLMLDRREEQLAAGNRPSSMQTLRLGARGDGRLTAMQLTSHGSAGIGSGAGTARPFLRIYGCPNRRAEEYDVFINAGPGRAFRAPGHPQGCFALEQTIDLLASKLGMDPLALRLKNDSHPVRRAQLELGAKRIGWARRNAIPGSGSGRLRRGIGVASGLWYDTGRGGSELRLTLHDDGKLEIFSGAQDLGTGMRTVLAVVVAEELGLEPADLSVNVGHTSWPYGPGSGGSKTTPILAPTARRTAYQLKLRLFEAARPLLKVSAKTPLDLRGGKIFVRGKPGQAVTFKQVLARIPGGTLTVQERRPANYGPKGKGDAWQQLIAGVQFAEVEVDTLTGAIRPLKIVAVHDCGRVINRLAARSQVYGGVIQGVSYALYEERILDPRTGCMTNPNLEQYKIAGALDIPEIDAVLFDVYLGSNNTGAVGIGEPVTVPTAAALANAVHNALGVAVRDLPMTPERVLAALAGKSKGVTP